MILLDPPALGHDHPGVTEKLDRAPTPGVQDAERGTSALTGGPGNPGAERHVGRGDAAEQR
jgi:hypothetical protein